MKKVFIVVFAALVAATQGAFAQSYYTGDGGRGKTLAILAPEGSGLGPDEGYLPTLVQGVLVDDFTKFSAMTVYDRQNLDKLLVETENMMYSEDADVARVGRLAGAQYVLVGSVTKTSSYLLQLRVMDTKTGSPVASYTASAARAEMDDFSAVNTAAADLLSQMGVTLTDSGLAALEKAADSTTRKGQTALAQGIAAQREGNTVAALAQFYEARDADSSLSEAASRLGTLSRAVSSGNLGDNVHSEIEQRNAWKKTLEDAIAYFNAHPFVDVVYNTALTQGKIDFAKNEVVIETEVWLTPNARFEAFKDIAKAMYKVGYKKFDTWQLGSLRNRFLGSYIIKIDAELLDNDDLFLGRATLETYVSAGGSTAELTQRHWSPGSDWARKDHLNFTVKADELTNTQRVRFTSVLNVIAVTYKDKDKGFEAYFCQREFRAKNVKVERRGIGSQELFVRFPLE